MSRTRSVSVCLVLAGMFAATTAHAEGLPNGAVLEFRRLYIKENGGGFQEPSTSDVLRMYLNQAHCVCAASGAGNEQEIEWELALNPQVTTGLGKPISLWVGTNCSDDIQRPMTCKQTGTIADIDMLAVSTARGSWNLADLINGTSTTSNCAGIDKATAWALVDTDGNGTPDYNLPKDVGSTSSPAVTVDTTPPPLPTDFKAQSAEGGVRLSWTLPTANMTDIKYFQALCADADGNPREGTATAPRYQTAGGLCGVNLVPVLEPSAIEGEGDLVTEMDLPEGLRTLDNAFLCGESTESTATGMLIDGLANGTSYKIVLLSVDYAGNFTGTYFDQEITPQPATDFWEDLHDRGSDVEGGFCLLAETYGTNSPLTNLLRAFRDETLGGGSLLTRAYYATLGKLGGLVHGSLALRIVAAIVLAPLVLVALLWHVLTLPGLLALVALGIAWRKRWLKLPRFAASAATSAPLVLAGVLLVPAVARAQGPAPYWDGEDAGGETAADDEDQVTWHAGLRVGPYMPDIDKQFGQSPGPYEDMFGGARYTPMLDVDRFLWHPMGQLGIGASIGYMQKTAKAWVEGSMPGDPERMRSPGDENTFRLIPLALTATYRFTYLDGEFGVPLVPYVRGGLAYYMWWVRTNGKTAGACWDGTHTQGCDSDPGRGASVGLVGSIGLAIRAERIDANAASSMKQSGILHAGFYGELSMAKVDGFGSDTKLSVGDTTWFAGVNFEF